MCRSSLPLVFVGWTLFVWGNRISNIIDDRSTGGATLTLGLIVASMIVALALVSAIAEVRGGHPQWLLPALVVVTAGVWALRVPIIAIDADHGVGFKLVHAGLAVVSILLGAAAWRSSPRRGVRSS